ncbi:hypothetical protein [Simplicispira psychrophila]|uniref:hypothetical protein n=1 Tax=Simplicispira psychrophila TaxID=80882 RepID=UPI000487CADD|nr:hypothetical protein [Simplicispira psychrophila]
MATKTTQSKDAAISDVLNQNIEAAEQIKSSANELVVVHAVLSTKVAKQGDEVDLQAAVKRTAEIEQQLSQTAEALDSSNQRLSEID